MKFYISKLILWPNNPKNTVQVLSFCHDKINIIHGRSGTGKSAIISIIDYCLGSSRCSIPVGIIREKVEWFGLLVNIDGTNILIARKSPLSKDRKECHLSIMENNDLPSQIIATSTLSEFKDKINNILKITNLSISDNLKSHDGRPSYRDMISFNFLPQHIVANPNILFYKADSYLNKEKLKKIFPYTLGIVDVEYLLKEKEYTKIKKECDQLEKQLENQKKAFSYWSEQIKFIWNEAVELGLIEIAEGEDYLTTLKKLNDVFITGNLSEKLSPLNYQYTNDQYKKSYKEEEELQSRVDQIRKKIRNYEKMSNNAEFFTEAVTIEKTRAVNIQWLKDKLIDDAVCVICGNKTSHLNDVIQNIENKLHKLEKMSNVLQENPIVDKQIEQLKIELIEKENELNIIRKRRLKLEMICESTKDSISRVYLLFGKLQSLLNTLSEVDEDSDLVNQIKKYNENLIILTSYFLSKKKELKEDFILNEINELIKGHGRNLKLQKESPMLDIKELTLSFKSSSQEEKEYLWEVGSGENWMGYHLATFLALHEYFIKNPFSPVFSFLVIDQPSQVYFPSASTGANQLDTMSQEQFEKLKQERDADIQATKRIFSALERGRSRSIDNVNYNYQIIVLEHADSSIWGDIANTHEVVSWKEKNMGLIPIEWI